MVSASSLSIVMVLLLAPVVLLQMNIDSAKSQVNSHNLMKVNKTFSNLSNHIILANNEGAINTSNQKRLELKIVPNVPNMSAVFTAKKHNPLNSSVLKNNSNMTYMISNCCKTTTNALNNDLGDITESINQIKRSLDEFAFNSRIEFGLGFAAIALSVIIPYLYEKAKKPNLQVQASEPSTGPSEVTFLHCKVVNIPHQRGFGQWFGIERNPAINTRVTMQFLKLDGKTRIPSAYPEKIPAKWSNAPEPLSPDRRSFDSTKLALLYKETVVSDHNGEDFAVVVKHGYDVLCYIVTGDNYLPPLILRNPRYTIGDSKFLVKIQAVSGNSSSRVTTFIINNEPKPDKFMISSYTSEIES